MKSLNRMQSLFLLLIILTLFFISCSPLKNEPEEIKKADIYLLPLEEFPSSVIDELIGHYQQKFKVAIARLQTIPLEGPAIDHNRRQVIAEELIETIKRKYQPVLTNPKAIVIGLTSNDMYIRKYDWQFAFTFRDGDRFAVISCARMNPVNFGERPDDHLLRSRIRKMVTKDIGLLYFGLSPTNNPKSVLYSGIAGVEELDAVGEDF